MIPSYYEFQNSVKIMSGTKALENIPYELGNWGAKRPIIITDKGLVQAGLVDRVLGALKESDLAPGAMYDAVPPDSSVQVVNDIARVYREHRCDSILAVGGGSVIDTAKGVSVVIAENADDLREFMGVEILKKRRNFPFIVVPTTAGTGSEATLVAVIADPERQIKMEFVSYYLLPDAAVLDPRMTLSLPPKMTAATGMDTLTHAIEAYTGTQKNPLSDAYAMAAIHLIRQYLVQAVEDGRNQEARLALANASLMAGAAFSNSMVGIVHAIGHALGGVSHVPHGEAMSILLPFGMEYNLDTVGKYYEELLLPLAGSEVYAHTPASQRADKSITVVREMLDAFRDRCGLPTRLKEAGVRTEDFNRIADTAVHDGAVIANPKAAAVKDVLLILEKAY